MFSLTIKISDEGRRRKDEAIMKIKIVKKIEFAIAIAASVLTLCFAATKTSVAPVNTCPRFPMTIGAAITEISAMCFLYLIIVIFSK